MAQAQMQGIMFEGLGEGAREAWSRWLASMQGSLGHPWLRQVEQAYSGGIEASERMVQQSLRMQGDLLQQLRASLENGAFADQPASQLTRQWLAMVEQGLEQRGTFWQNWFASARSVDFDAIEKLFEEAGRGGDVFAAWRNLSSEAMDRQAQLLRNLLPQNLPLAVQPVEVVVEEAKADTEAKSKPRPTRTAGSASA